MLPKIRKWILSLILPCIFFVTSLYNYSSPYPNFIDVLYNYVLYSFVLFVSRKVYMYAFHLKQGGVIWPHSWMCPTNIICNMNDHEYLLIMYIVTDCYCYNHIFHWILYFLLFTSLLLLWGDIIGYPLTELTYTSWMLILANAFLLF